MELAWCGKLPSVGDFVWSARRTALRSMLDEWLHTGMHQLRVSLADDWLSIFERSPVWNFVLPSALDGCEWIAGCITPSCDRIGRRFPFVVAHGFTEKLSSRVGAAQISSTPKLLALTGTAMFQGISRGWSREMLLSSLEEASARWQDSLEFDAQRIALPQGRPDTSGLLAETDLPGCADRTQPIDRDSAWPWADMPQSLSHAVGTSFWWTHSAGKAPLRAFTYNERLDGSLMMWLYGQRP